MALALRLTRLFSHKGTILRNLHNTAEAIKNTSSFLPPITLSSPNNWIWRKNNPIGTPVVNPGILDLPNTLKWIPPPTPLKEIAEPTSNENNVKQAARLIVIRRKKIKKHKLKKLRLRMRFEWAKVRQRREWKKEKEFQATLIAQCKAAEAFSAADYVEERLRKLEELLAAKKVNESLKTK